MTSDNGQTRRSVLGALAALGVGSTAFQRAVAQQAAIRGAIDAEMIEQAEWVAGVTLPEGDRAGVAAAVARVLRKREQLYEVEIGYDELPSLRFDPEAADPDAARRASQCPAHLESCKPKPAAPKADDGWSWLTIRQLGLALRTGAVTSVGLTEYFLNRLKELNVVLKCVVTLTEDLAYRQAERADKELAAGKDRGPLHGIPWGAKDLIAVTGYPTTWGAPQFKDQTLEETATVAQKMEAAGAVLIAKLSLGALAMGDRWFGGQTRNPWNPRQGSSGSSAGSASAVAAGAVPVALGSETLGSIVSPSKRCGVTGLRPTFGRVSRAGCMSLSWSMDKIGPIARSVDDCGIVFDVLNGRDPADPTTVDRWFEWPMKADLKGLQVGRVENVRKTPEEERLLEILEECGANIVPVRLPDEFSEWALTVMLDAEAAAVFHPLVAENNLDGINSWSQIFQKMHYFTAVDYLHAARVRSRLMKLMHGVFDTVDVYVGSGDLGITNLTGHPTLVQPVLKSEGEYSQPQCATLSSRLYDEATLLAMASIVEDKVQPGQWRPTIEMPKPAVEESSASDDDN